jgi:hypothetical protein
MGTGYYFCHKTGNRITFPEMSYIHRTAFEGMMYPRMFVDSHEIQDLNRPAVPNNEHSAYTRYIWGVITELG